MSNTKRWIIREPLNDAESQALAAFPPILRQLLVNRGYRTDADARLFLRAQSNLDLDPFKMTGMQKVVERIRAAIIQKEPVVIYGDYDVDGVTATALLVQTLLYLGADVQPYIPNRFDEGYGLNPEALLFLHNRGIRLVLSVDCGIRSPAEAVYAREIGLDLIITDHHQPAEGPLPPAYAVINPKQEGDEYPDKDLAGVGVAYKIAQALLLDADSLFAAQGRIAPLIPPSEFLENQLDLVALGTVADLAPLTGENRLLVRRGLKKLRSTQRQGLFSLANVAELPLKQANTTHIGFVLGPRLNAAGRLESALASYDILTTTDVFKAGELAQQLNLQNRQRQELTRKIQEQAESMALADERSTNLLFAVHPEFNSGVVGLAAARLVEKYYRPAVVGQVLADGTTRCSCRSIPEFHITQALDLCKDLLVRHGGHAAAAGFTVQNSNLEALRERLSSIADEFLSGQDLRHIINADMEVSLSDLQFELLKHLEYFQPTGFGNPEAIFVSRDVLVKSSRAVGSEGKHLKLTVTDGHNYMDAIGFRLGHLQSNLPPRLDLVYSFETNEFNGHSSLQLNLKDIRPAGLAE